MNSDAGAGALEQFTILAKGTKGNGCAALIQQVLSTRKIVVFGELLAMQSMQALRGTEHEPSLKLLEIFAYGTYADYQNQRTTANLPELTTPQLRKLRLLTMLTLAHKHESIPYATLFQALGLDGNVREVEDLIIEAIYMGFLSGRLDQRRGLFRVKGAVGRDVRLEDVEGMIGKLRKWLGNAEMLLENFEERMRDIHAGRAELQQQRHKYVQQFEQVKTQLNTGVQPYRGGGGGGGGVGGFDGMDGYDDIEAFFPGEGVGGGGGGVGGRRKSAAEGRFKRKSNREPTSRPRNK
ncbi:cop9 signalosome complex subunit 7b isoform x1 [Nannochloropsis oceanica]